MSHNEFYNFESRMTLGTFAMFVLQVADYWNHRQDAGATIVTA